MRIATLLTALTLALTSATANAQSVSFDYDKGADFAKLKTYAWIDGTILLDEFNHKRVVAAVDAQLGAKGLTQVQANGKPDVFVAYHASFDRNFQINAFSSGWGVGPGFGGNRSGSASVDEIVNGTLVIDMVDANTHGLVWRGIARKEIDVKANPERRDRNVNKAAEKLFKNFPPKK
jgi:hypothetical protein